mgnify:CR=1 FL=1
MTLNNIPQFIPASDRSILVKFGEEISDKIHQQVFTFYRFVLKKQIKVEVSLLCIVNITVTTLYWRDTLIPNRTKLLMKTVINVQCQTLKI